MKRHCTDQFWYKWDASTGYLTRHTYDDRGTTCHPLSQPNGLRLDSPPVFLGGTTESVPDGCVTEDMHWIIDLPTMRACRMCQFQASLGVKILTSCPRGIHFLALLQNKDNSPIMHLCDASLKWLPEETRHVTRAAACDVKFRKVALYMSHTQQLVVWNRRRGELEHFARCPGIADFVTCCHTHRIYAITFEGPQRMLTFDTDAMEMVAEKIISDTKGHYGRVFKHPCFPTQPTTPYVTEGDQERPRWAVGDVQVEWDENRGVMRPVRQGI